MTGQEVAADVLWNADDVAAYAKVSVTTVQRMTRAGDLPFVYFGRQIRYDPTELLPALRARREAKR